MAFCQKNLEDFYFSQLSQMFRFTIPNYYYIQYIASFDKTIMLEITLSYDNTRIQGIPVFRDFTIRDPRYFVNLFQASISWIPLYFMILSKKIQKNFFFLEKFLDFFFLNFHL